MLQQRLIGIIAAVGPVVERISVEPVAIIILKISMTALRIDHFAWREALQQLINIIAVSLRGDKLTRRNIYQRDADTVSSQNKAKRGNYCSFDAGYYR